MTISRYEYESNMWFVTYGYILKLIIALTAESHNL